ncbi:MAG: methionine synthase [Ruminococcus sp.]|nr:methionine synthase [Ruminococcus sp.]
MKLERINTELAVRYMGGSGRDITSLMPLISECEKLLLEAAAPAYIFKHFAITGTDEGISLDGTDLVLTGSSIEKHLEGCESCILLCATLSSSVDRLIKTLSVSDIAASYVVDCMASASIEDICDAAEQEMKQKLPDKHFTWRFSPGYGDLPLSVQGKLLDVMNAGKRIGLSVTDSDMMIPSKSVTAVIGVSGRELNRQTRSCLDCNMYESCDYRKGGDRCGSQETS